MRLPPKKFTFLVELRTLPHFFVLDEFVTIISHQFPPLPPAESEVWEVGFPPSAIANFPLQGRVLIHRGGFKLKSRRTP